MCLSKWWMITFVYAIDQQLSVIDAQLLGSLHCVLEHASILFITQNTHLLFIHQTCIFSRLCQWLLQLETFLLKLCQSLSQLYNIASQHLICACEVEMRAHGMSQGWEGHKQNLEANANYRQSRQTNKQALDNKANNTVALCIDVSKVVARSTCGARRVVSSCATSSAMGVEFWFRLRLIHAFEVHTYGKCNRCFHTHNSLCAIACIAYMVRLAAPLQEAVQSVLY